MEQKVHDSLIVDGVKGVYGKAPFDTSFLHQTQWDGDTLPSVPNVNYGQMRNGLNFSGNVKDITTTDDKIFHFSFDYLTNDVYMPNTMWTKAYTKTDGKVTLQNYSNTTIFSVSNAGKVTSNNMTVVAKLTPNEWYHFDFVF